MPLYRQKCETAKKNRTSDKGGCLHTGGSISMHEHAICLSQELGWIDMSMKFFNKHILEHQQENLSMKGRGGHIMCSPRSCRRGKIEEPMLVGGCRWKVQGTGIQHWKCQCSR